MLWLYQLWYQKLKYKRKTTLSFILRFWWKKISKNKKTSYEGLNEGNQQKRVDYLLRQISKGELLYFIKNLSEDELVTVLKNYFFKKEYLEWMCFDQLQRRFIVLSVYRLKILFTQNMRYM